MLNPNNNLVGIGILPTFASNNNQIPKAYLIAQFYNETNQPTHQKILYVTQNNQFWNTLGEIQEIALENGRVEIFVANESNTKVYFDNLSIYKSPTPIVQENHYYPFGMNLVGIEKEGTPNHRFQYNGKEKETSFGLNWLEYGMRDYDAQIGRFHKIDRFSEKYYDLNPYHYGGNNPISYIDINGDSIWVTTTHNTEHFSNGMSHTTVTNTIYYQGKLLDNTGRVDVNALASGIQEEFAKLGISSKQETDGHTVETNFNFDISIDVVKNMSEVNESDHLMVVVDKVLGDADPKLSEKGGGAGGLALRGGKIAYISNNDNWVQVQ